MDNIKRLVVRKRNKLLTVMEMLNLRQESDERILSFLSRLKAKARQCELSSKCSCGLSVDYTDHITLYMLVTGINDQEIQEDLLAIDKLTNKVEEGIKMFDPYKITCLLSDWCKHGVGFLLLQKHCRCPPKTSGEINPLCCKSGWIVTMVGSCFTIPAEAV